jgi:predicted nuclease of predicted toxin-antitoxin system
VKVLLDEMWPPTIAVALRQRGHDVETVKDRPDLIGRPDPVVFGVAQAEGRAIVTENAADFRPLAVECLREGRSHHGLILTSNKRHPRHEVGTFGRLVEALDSLPTVHGQDSAMNLEHWLQ